MTTNGGGWTRYVNIKDEYSFEDAKQCWLAKSNWENAGKTIECFNPNRLNFIVSEYMVKQNSQDDGSGIWITWAKKFKKSYPSMIENVQYADNRKCKGLPEYAVVMSNSSAYPETDLSNVSWVRM